MECVYCKSVFATKTNLNTHQRTAKYCLKLRENLPGKEYVCKGCDKIFTQQSNLERHIEICKVICKVSRLETELEYKNNYIEKLEQTIKELQHGLKDVAVIAVSRPTTITTTNNTHTQNNNQNNILMNLTPFEINKENFAEKINEHFNKNYLINGQKGVAQFAVDKILKDDEGKLMYICTDPSRQIYRFKSIDGFVERDVKAKKLTTALYDELRSKSHSISNEEMKNGDSSVFMLYSGRFQDIKELEEDNSEFRIELANLTSK